jgi:hypothetical protein
MQELTPAPVAQFGHLGGGPHDVGEEHRGQQGRRLASVGQLSPSLVQEGLDLACDAVGVPDEQRVVASWELGVAGTGYLIRQVS